MNPIIDLMIKENNLSKERLKQIFRVMAKKTHPDLVNKRNEFIKLKMYYEEANDFIIKNNQNLNQKNDNIETIFLESLFKFYLLRNCKISNEKLDHILYEIEIYSMEFSYLLRDLITLSTKERNLSQKNKTEQIFICIQYYYHIIKKDTYDTIKLFLSYENNFINKLVNDNLNICIKNIYIWLKEDLEKRGIVN
jgi:hypothetical protein